LVLDELFTHSTAVVLNVDFGKGVIEADGNLDFSLFLGGVLGVLNNVANNRDQDVWVNSNHNRNLGRIIQRRNRQGSGVRAYHFKNELGQVEELVFIHVLGRVMNLLQ